MRVLRFKDNQPEWDIPLAELEPAIKKALRLQWREFIHEMEDAEAIDIEPNKVDATTITMFERLYKAS
jgi:hypothetical protein